MDKVPRLEDYHVDAELGFLLRDPLETLPVEFRPWSELAAKCHVLGQERSLREAVDDLPLLDHSRLRGHRQHCHAYVLLSFIGAGYIWQEGEEKQASRVPRQLAIPWAGVAAHLGLQPCHTYVSTVLANWSLKVPSRPVHLDNMRPLCLTPGGEESGWFFLVSAQTELEGAPGLVAIIRAMRAVVEDDKRSLLKALSDLRISIINIKTKAFARMHDHLTPTTFYEQVRVYFKGYGDAKSGSGGVVFEGVDPEEPRVAVGASAAQSPLIQCLDAALRLEHDPGPQSYLTKVRNLMLPAHRRFVEALWNGPDIRAYTLSQADHPLADAYNACVLALVELREYHMKAVNKWVVVPSKRSAHALVGAGGQQFIPFFQSIRNSTFRHKLLLQ